MSNEDKSFKATNLRGILIFIMVAVIGASVAGFWYGLQQIRAQAIDVNHAAQDANASNEKVEQIQVLQQQLAQAQTLVAKADKLFASPEGYQSQAIKDLQRYAAEAGVSISSTDFPPADPAALGTTRQVVVTITQPVSYARLIRFLQLIETSIPKMQVQGVTVSRPAQASGDLVNVEPLTINISVQ